MRQADREEEEEEEERKRKRERLKYLDFPERRREPRTATSRSGS